MQRVIDVPAYLFGVMQAVDEHEIERRPPVGGEVGVRGRANQLRVVLHGPLARRSRADLSLAMDTLENDA